MSFFNSDGKPNGLGDSYHLVDCDDPSEEASFYPDNFLEGSCAYYNYKYGSYYCKKCAWGLTGKVQTIPLDENNNNPTRRLPPNNTEYYVDCSETIEFCQTDVVYGGSAWNNEWLKDMYGFSIPNKFSCHSCDGDRIPFLVSDIDVEMESVEEDGFLTQCLEPTRNGLGLDGEEFISFPNDCALGYKVNGIDNLSEIENVQSKFQCLACKNGFKPVYSNNKYYIIDCEEISHCKTNDDDEGWFNACKTCSSGYTHEFEENTRVIKVDSCIESDEPNCMAYIPESENCEICEIGFIRNYDQKCEALTPPSCVDYKPNSFTLGNIKNYQMWSLFYFIWNKGHNCNECSEGYKSINISRTSDICLHSDYLTDGEFLAETDYIDGCKNYDFNQFGGLICEVCLNDKITNKSKTGCFDKPTNCKFVQDNNIELCEECQEFDGDTPVIELSDRCSETIITDCKTYVADQPELVCDQCEGPHILKDNKCEFGPIENCSNYNKDLKCISCYNNFTLIIGDGVRQCVKIPSEVNCLEGSIVNDKFECVDCEQNFSVSSS